MIYESAGAGGGCLSSASLLTRRVFNVLITAHDTFCTWTRVPLTGLIFGGGCHFITAARDGLCRGSNKLRPII